MSDKDLEGCSVVGGCNAWHRENDKLCEAEAAIAELLMVLHDIEGGGGVQGEIATAALAKYEIPTTPKESK